MRKPRNQAIFTSFYKIDFGITFAIHVNPITFAVLIFKHNMANHKSAEKRIRANEAKRVRNRYQAKTAGQLRKEIKNHYR